MSRRGRERNRDPQHLVALPPWRTPVGISFYTQFTRPISYHRDVVNFDSQGWVIQVQSLRVADTLRGSTLITGEWNSLWHPSALREKAKMSKSSRGGGLMFWSPAVLEEMQNHLPWKTAYTFLPGRGRRTQWRSLGGQTAGGDSVFLTTHMEDVSKHWLTIHVAIEQIITFIKPTTMTFFLVPYNLSYNLE